MDVGYSLKEKSMIKAPDPILLQVSMPISFEKRRGKTVIPAWQMEELEFLMLSSSFWYNIVPDRKVGTWMVDSGGFQFGGKQKRDKLAEFFSIREKLYRWQCLYGDYIIGGDIPISLTRDFEFIRKCLLLSMDNMDLQFKLGCEGRFVNVAHGHSPDVLRYWYKGVKGYPSIGWSLGSSIKTAAYGFILQLLTLYELGEFHAKSKILHCLGAVSVDVVVGMHFIIEKLGIELEVLSFDASSSSAERFGTLIDENGVQVGFAEIRSGKTPFKLWDGTVITMIPATLTGKFREDASRTNMVNTKKVWDNVMVPLCRNKGEEYDKIAERSGAVWMYSTWKAMGIDAMYSEMERTGMLSRVRSIEMQDEFRIL